MSTYLQIFLSTSLTRKPAWWILQAHVCVRVGVRRRIWALEVPPSEILSPRRSCASCVAQIVFVYVCTQNEFTFLFELFWWCRPPLQQSRRVKRGGGGQKMYSSSWRILLLQIYNIAAQPLYTAWSFNYFFPAQLPTRRDEKSISLVVGNSDSVEFRKCEVRETNRSHK